MAIYRITVQEHMVGAGLKAAVLDLTVLNAGKKAFDLYLDGMRGETELFRFLYTVYPGEEPERTLHFKNFGVTTVPFTMRFVTNERTPGHVILRLYVKDRAGQIIAVLSENQLEKLAD